jgi:hypothetical protein
MKKIGRISKATVLALTLMMAILAGFPALPTMGATKEVVTFAYVWVAPNPVGVRQT